MKQLPLTFLTLSALWLTAASTVSGQAPTSLTTKDYVEIQQLTSQYAVALDTRMRDLWKAHPNYVHIPHNHSFMAKLFESLRVLEELIQRSDAVSRRSAGVAR